jgi:ferredoxin--NADP+ reductase
VDLIIKNLKEPKLSEGINALLKSGHKIIDQIAWERINGFEIFSGEVIGKSRQKISDYITLLRIGD